MKNVTENMNNQFEQMMDFQSRALEPMRIFAGIAADASEQFARKNYAVLGDVVEFSTKQVKLPLSGENLVDVAAAQGEVAKTFAELMNSRVAEYADMAQQLTGKMQEASESVSASFK